MGVGHAALPSNVTFSNIHVKIGLVQVQISAEYMFLYIGRYKTLHISRQYKPQA